MALKRRLPHIFVRFFVGSSFGEGQVYRATLPALVYPSLPDKSDNPAVKRTSGSGSWRAARPLRNRVAGRCRRDGHLSCAVKQNF